MTAITPDSCGQWRLTPLGRITEAIEMSLIFGLAGDLRGRRVLDVGTGDGSYAAKAHVRGAWAVGIDSDDRMVAAARTRFFGDGRPRSRVDAGRPGTTPAPAVRAGVDFLRASAEGTPFPDASFDVVLAVTVLCMLRDPGAAVGEMGRVLAPGGRLVIGELARWSAWAAGRRIRGRLGNATWRGTRFWSRHDLKEIVRCAGLRLDTVRGAVHYPPVTLAALALAPADPCLGRAHAPFAAFLAVAADKPPGLPPHPFRAPSTS